MNYKETATMPDPHIELPLGPIVGALTAGAITLLAWVIKLAARSSIEQFKLVMDTHTHALAGLTTEIAALRSDLTRLRDRVTRLEAGAGVWDDGK